MDGSRIHQRPFESRQETDEMSFQIETVKWTSTAGESSWVSRRNADRIHLSKEVLELEVECKMEVT